MKRVKLLTFLLVITAIGLAAMQIVFSTLFTTAGIDLSRIQTQEKAVEKENMLLGEQLYSKSSYLTIEQQAKEQGFVENAKARIVMTDLKAVALRQ